MFNTVKLAIPDPLAWELVDHNSYVDDLLKSVETKETAKRVIEEVEYICKCGF